MYLKKDKWIHEEYASQLVSSGGLDLQTLIDVVDWKVTRGKFRPLKGQIMKNEDDQVKELWLSLKEVFTNMTDSWKLCGSVWKEGGSSKSRKIFEKGFKKIECFLEEGIQILSELKGVGPATASAILAYSGNEGSHWPMMADEAVGSLNVPLKYDIKTYMAFCEEVYYYKYNNEIAKSAAEISDDIWAKSFRDHKEI